MLALLGTTLEQVTSPASMDRHRPMSVQIPASIAQALRAGTFVKIDPAAAVREQQREVDSEKQQQQLQQQQLEQEQQYEVEVQPEMSDEVAAESPVSQTSIMTRKTVDAMYVKVLEDDDEDDVETEEVESKKAQEQEEKASRRRKEEEDAKKRRAIEAAPG